MAQTYEEKRASRELLERFLAKMGAGVTVKTAASLLGISYFMIGRWISREADLATVHHPKILAFIEGETCEGQPRWTRTSR